MTWEGGELNDVERREELYDVEREKGYMNQDVMMKKKRIMNNRQDRGKWRYKGETKVGGKGDGEVRE